MRITHKLTVGIGFLVFLFLFIPTAVYAANEKTYEVSNSLLNVRSEPADGAEIVGSLSKGDNVIAFQEKYGWVQTYYGGEEAWVAKHHLIAVSQPEENSTPTVSQTSASAESVTVKANGVHIRTGPGTNHKVIGLTSSPDTYNIVETSGDWHKVNLGNGSTGWIASWLTDKATESEAVNSEKETSESESTGSGNDVSEPVSQNSNGSLEGYHIVLDPGHGGKDPGAIGINGVYEKDLVSSTADIVRQQLESAGANVTMTRSGDYFISLDERVGISNNHNTHAFVSLHYNSFPLLSVNGNSTFYYSNTDRTLAQQVQSAMASTTSLNNRGIMEGDYRVLRNTSAPSVLVELGFISNQYDLSVVQTSDYQYKAAEAITNGLKNYFHN
ncbi:N-acetylmuramoyl-L-alanine amidase [Virgibacillus ainsalahensis]